MSSRTSSVSYADSVSEAKGHQHHQTTTKKSSRFNLISRRSSSDSSTSSSASAAGDKAGRKLRDHPVVKAVAKAWKEHHESVNSAYDTYYGMGVRR
ncbi:hypothetical protein MN608_10934 [Microdochium nivale]|nr:hypothetical protein MN608_10934 [Microdochium nivale]